MIFVTVGSMFPFDRLIQRVDEIAAAQPERTFFAQVGHARYRPTHLPFSELLSRGEFRAKVEAAELLVAHAGMGSVITAMELGKPIILVPRRVEWGEHNTDHQVATAKWLQSRPGVHVCFDDAMLGETIEAALRPSAARETMSRFAPAALTDRLRAFIDRA